MVDGVAVAIDDWLRPSRPRFGIQFKCVPDSTHTDHSPHETLKLHRRSLPGDASAGSMLIEPGPDDAEDYLPLLLSRLAERLIEAIETSVLEDREDGVGYGELCSNAAAVETCKRLARKISPLMVLRPGLNWAAFGEDGGCVVLVLNSSITRRRVDFRVSADGQDISAISVDENMATNSSTVSAEDEDDLREKAAWVNIRA